MTRAQKFKAVEAVAMLANLAVTLATHSVWPSVSYMCGVAAGMCYLWAKAEN